MGFRFRKTFGSGPFRFTVSKRGVSASVGVKGLRVTSRADGRTQVTASIPGTGISYVQTFGASRESDPVTLCNALGSSAAPPCASVSVPDRYPVREVASGQQSHGDQASTGSGSDATRWLLAGGTTGAVIFILVVLAVLGVDPVVFWVICLALVVVALPVIGLSAGWLSSKVPQADPHVPGPAPLGNSTPGEPWTAPFDNATVGADASLGDGTADPLVLPAMVVEGDTGLPEADTFFTGLAEVLRRARNIDDIQPVLDHILNVNHSKMELSFEPEPIQQWLLVLKSYASVAEEFIARMEAAFHMARRLGRTIEIDTERTMRDAVWSIPVNALAQVRPHISEEARTSGERREAWGALDRTFAILSHSPRALLQYEATQLSGPGPKDRFQLLDLD